MHPKAPIFPSFLVSTLVSCTIFCSLALADTHFIDDQDDNAHIAWDGPWRASSDISAAMDGTLTLGNVSRETVTFTFTGTSVKVYGAFTPVGIWVMSSLYAIDGSSPTVFTPSPVVLQDTFGQEFYSSGPLPAGSHTLQITNMGVQLWLDYFQFDDDTVSVTSDLTSATSVIATSVAQSSSTTIITSSSLSPSSQDGSSEGTTSSTSEIATLAFSQPVTATSDTAVTTSSSPIPLTSATVQPSSLRTHSLHSTSTLSQNVTTPPPQGAQTPGANGHRHGMSYGALIGAIAGTVLGVVLLALLLQLWRGHLRARQTQARSSPLLFGASGSLSYESL